MNDRQVLLQMLRMYAQMFPSESSVAERIASLVRQHDDCCDRTCRPGHLTGSAWVVSADGERHLLLHHRKLNKWLQPGGHADGESDLVAVAMREAVEETGLQGLSLIVDRSGLEPLDLDVHEIPARLDPTGAIIEDAHEHHDFRFLLRVTGDESIAANEESNEIRWCSESEVRGLTSEVSVLRLLEKAKFRLRNT